MFDTVNPAPSLARALPLRDATRLSLGLFALLAAGCPSPADKPDQARFAEATDAEVAEAFQVAVGMPVVYASLAQLTAELDAGADCPAREELAADPLVVRYTAEACTSAFGIAYDGAAEVENPLLWSEEAPEGRTKATLAGFSVDDGALALAFDGSWSQSDVRPGVDHRTEADLVATVDGRAWTVAGAWDVAYADGVPVTTCDDVTGAVDGVGAFTVACEMIDFGATDGRGWVVVKGADTLRVELTRDADGCFPASVDGVERAPICLGGDGETPEIPDEVLTDMFVSGGPDTLTFGVEAVPDIAARVVFAVATDTLPVEHHPLDLEEGGGAVETWSVPLAADATYSAGASTRLAVEETLGAYMVAFAYDADDRLVDCYVANGDAGPIDISACPEE